MKHWYICIQKLSAIFDQLANQFGWLPKYERVCLITSCTCIIKGIVKCKWGSTLQKYIIGCWQITENKLSLPCIDKRAAKCIKKYSNIKERKYEVEDIILTDNDKMQYDRALEGRNSARRVVLQKFQKEKSKLNYFKFFLLLVQWWWRAFNKVHFSSFIFYAQIRYLKGGQLYQKKPGEPCYQDLRIIIGYSYIHLVWSE